MRGDNQPIPIKNEHEIAHLYLGEVYNHLFGCNILQLNMDAILTILSKASSFPENLRKQASVVKEVRNKWLCSNLDHWTKDQTREAMSAMMQLAQMVPGAQKSLKTRGAKFPGIVFHSNVQRYRSSINDGQHSKVQFKIEKLQSDQGREIYVERSYKNTNTGQTTSDVKDLLLLDRVVLLKGEAGAGKSSVVTKLIQRWAEGEEAEDISCILFLSAGSQGKLSLQRTIWDGNLDTINWKEEDFHEAYICIKDLAIEGKIAVLIDGLDEIGDMTSNDVSNASQASANPHMEVDIRTACAGILSQKIIPCAKVLATGRNITLINEQLPHEKALLYGLVPLNEADRDVMVEKMLKDNSERKRVHQELQRISTKSNELFFKTPFLLKNIIQLVIERKVDVNNLKCPSEVYLMLAMKNLDFQKDEITNFLELEPPEDQDYLKMCMMVCQQKIQESSGDINTIEGVQRNVKKKGPCFEQTVFKERLQIPMEFIRKLGFFDVRKGESKVFLDVVHLSYLEFCCGGSLCREGVNIEEELSKIKDEDRYEAVATYMAGLFCQNPSIQFLNTVKHVAENFLYLLGNDNRDACLQEMYRAITKRPDPGYGSRISVTIMIPGEGAFVLQRRATHLLVEALKASSDRMSPQPTITDIYVSDAYDEAATKVIFQLLSLLHILEFTSFELGGRDGFEMKAIKLEKDNIRQLIASSWTDCGDGTLSISPFIDWLRSHSVETVEIKKVDCKTEFSLIRFKELFSVSSLQHWFVDKLNLDYERLCVEMQENPWQGWDELTGQGSINSITIKQHYSHRYYVKNWIKEELGAVSVSIDHT